MNLESLLMQRANSRCELCSSDTSLSVYELPASPGQTEDSSVLLCAQCLSQLNQPQAAALNHWRCLGESMWSQHAAVQVIAYRILKKLDNAPWAADLLSQLYLDEATQTWADAVPSREEDSEQLTVLDSNGTPLLEGDTVTLIKDLDVKGANFTAKRGTVVKNISLTNDPKFIEGRVNGTRIVLVAAYLKKA